MVFTVIVKTSPVVRLKLYLRAAEPPRLVTEGRRGPHRAQLVAPVPDRLQSLGVQPHGRRRGCKQVRLGGNNVDNGRQCTLVGDSWVIIVLCQCNVYACFQHLSLHPIGGRKEGAVVVVSTERGKGET